MRILIYLNQGGFSLKYNRYFKKYYHKLIDELNKVVNVDITLLVYIYLDNTRTCIYEGNIKEFDVPVYFDYGGLSKIDLEDIQYDLAFIITNSQFKIINYPNCIQLGTKKDKPFTKYMIRNFQELTDLSYCFEDENVFESIDQYFQNKEE